MNQPSDAHTPDDSGPLGAYERMHRQLAEAHIATQRAMADNHAAYLRASEIVLRLAAGQRPPAAQEDEPVIPTSPIGEAPVPIQEENYSEAGWVAPAPDAETHDEPADQAQHWHRPPDIEVADGHDEPADRTAPEDEPSDHEPAPHDGDGGQTPHEAEPVPAPTWGEPPIVQEPTPLEDEWQTATPPVSAVPDDDTIPYVAPDAAREPALAPLALRRLALVAHEEAAPGNAMPNLRAGSRVLLAGGPDVVRNAVGKALTAAGLELATHPAYLDALICLHGLTEDTGPRAAHEAARGAFIAAQSVATHPPAVFIAVQDGGGDFALSGRSPTRAWTAGFAAFTRTLAREWPETATKTIDIAEPDPDRLAMRLTRELVFGGAEDMVALTADNRRLVPREAELHAAANAPLALAHDAVLVVSGGARGVTAACLTALCQGRRLRLCLLGRTAYDPAASREDAVESNQAARDRVLSEAAAAGRSLSPAELLSALGELRAQREVREAVTQLTEAGAEIRYHAIDITDQAAVNEAVARTRDEFGRIDGVIHAAGIIADRRVADKTEAQFARVVATKVEGLANLLAATAADDLSLLVMFAALAGRYGNLGQADYAIANATLTAVARAEALRRGPSCLVKTIAWGPWDGGMLDAGLRSSFARHDVAADEQASGAAAFLAELAEPAGDVVSTDIVLAPPAAETAAYSDAAQ